MRSCRIAADRDKQTNKDMTMETLVFQIAAETGAAAADKATDAIRAAIAEKGSANIILATGASQFDMLENLVAAENIDWSKVTMFHLDEYIKLGPDHPASFRKYLTERFIQKVQPLAAAHLVNGDADDPQQECDRIGDVISEHPIDVAMIGIGENGARPGPDTGHLHEHPSDTKEQVPDSNRARPTQGRSSQQCPRRPRNQYLSGLDTPAARQLHNIPRRRIGVTTVIETRAHMPVKIPGLVDLQVNGYQGVDFAGPDLTADDFVQACTGHFKAGTTALLATVVTGPRQLYERNLPLIAEAITHPELEGRVLGIHIEGPFISAKDGARGAHNAEWVRKPDTGLLDEIIAWANGKVRLLTIAAELPGASELARHALSQGIAVSLGHQMATASDLNRLADAGATALTHLGNGVPSQIDRHENPIWPALANDNLAAMIITDGNHLPPAVLKTIIRAKTPEKCIVISDASELSGLAPGRYESMGHKVILDKSGRLYDPKTGYLAGSSATMLKCMNHLASLNLLTLEQMTKMAFDNPLQLIGLGPSDVNRSNVCYDQTARQFHCE